MSSLAVLTIIINECKIFLYSFLCVIFRQIPRLGRALVQIWKPDVSNQLNQTNKRSNELPMAKGLPFLGTTFDLIAAGSAPNLHKYIDSRHQQFGPIFRERMIGQDLIFISSANLINSVFLHEGPHPVHPLPDSWTLYNQLHKCQRGLFFMDGIEWHTNRKILNRLMLQGNLDWMNQHIEYCTENLIEKWRTEATNANGYLKINNLEKQLYRWAIDVVCAVMFGYGVDNTSKQLSSALDEFSNNVHKIFENSAHLMNIPPKLACIIGLKIWKQFERDVTEVLRMGNNIIDMHMKQVDGDIEDVGLFGKMQSAEMPMDVIKRIFVDLILAAGDTTAFTSQWALYLLSGNKTIQENIRNEHGSEGETVRGLIRETLRLYPVAPFIGRIMPEDVVIGNYEIKRNQLVCISLYTSGRNPDYFPDPLKVKPERWYHDPDTGKFSDVLQPHGTIPFGIGSRSCIGKKLALSQLHRLVSSFCRDFEVECLNKEPIDMVLRLIAVPNQTLELGVKLIAK